MKIHVVWKHSSFKILDLVAIGNFDPRAQKSRSSKFWQLLIFFPEIFRGLSKIEKKMRNHSDFFSKVTNEALLNANHFFLDKKISKLVLKAK